MLFFPAVPLKMAAVRFTLLVAALLSLLFSATPVNAFVIRYEECIRRSLLCDMYKPRHCNDCVDSCEWAAWTSHDENVSRHSGYLSRRCKLILKKLAARGETGN